jgi:protein phosphatase
VRLAAGDVLLLATDGLTDTLNDDAIAGRLNAHFHLNAACQALIDDALAQGARDDVSVVLARFSEASDD